MIECTPSSLASVVGSREHTLSYELGTYNHERALLVELVNDFGQDGPGRSLVKQGRTRESDWPGKTDSLQSSLLLFYLYIQ